MDPYLALHPQTPCDTSDESQKLPPHTEGLPLLPLHDEVDRRRLGWSGSVCEWTPPLREYLKPVVAVVLHLDGSYLPTVQHREQKLSPRQSLPRELDPTAALHPSALQS